MGPGAFLFFLHLRLLRCLRLRLSVLALSCPGDVKRDPSYPPLVGSPSLPTPGEDREDGYTTRGGRRGFFFCPLGLVTAKPYSCRGLALSCLVFVRMAVQALLLFVALCFGSCI